jgi:hypothetical protein
MAKSNKDRDRRAVVEQMRLDQKRAERRRTIVVISACVVVALVIIGLAAIPLIKQNRLTSGAIDKIGEAQSAAGCQAVTKKKATGNQEHKPEGTPITYADAPPAFGPHYPVTAPFERKFYSADDRPQLEYLVHNLEHGYTLLWYDATIADDSDQLAAVKAIAAKFEGTELTDKFIAVPWTSKDGKAFPKGTHVALSHWSAGGDPSDVSKQEGVWQYCAKPSGAVVAQFTKKYPFSDSPEPQAR